MTTKDLAQSQGYTLIELIIALSLSAVLALVASSALIAIGGAGAYGRRSAELEASSRFMDEVLRRYIGSAVHVDWTSGNIGNIASGRGLIKKFRSGFSLSAAAPFEAIGLFIREAGSAGSSFNRGDLRATALYFKNPSPTTSGELKIVTSPHGMGAARLSPSQAQIEFDSIVELELSPGVYNVASGDAVRIMNVRVVTRKFTSEERGDWRWCPSDRINRQASCRTKAPFRDIEKNFKLVMYNNAIETTLSNSDGSPHRETLLGNIYFYSEARNR